MEEDEVKVKRWSFCPTCKGQGCETCDGIGKVFELVLLKSIISRLIRKDYEVSQVDFIQEQLKGH